MAVVRAIGWEPQAVLVESMAISGTASYSTSTFRTGAASGRCNPASGASGSWSVPNAQGNFVHFGFRIATLPSVARVMAGNAGVGNINLLLNTDGSIAVRNNTTVLGTSAALSTNTWYWIGLRNVASATGVLLQVDGVDSVSGTNGANTLSTLGFTGTEASAADVFFDDYISDGAGFLQPSKVNLAVPISDNARATLWTGGAGGTTNLFDAVDNKPPVGTATETNTTQIEHAGGAAGTTDAYDANMTTYTNLGINAGDTVIAIDWMIIHGEDVATGTKLLNFSLVSNPTQASGLANFAAGADVGALGTFPSNWSVALNTIITSPSVTLDTSPVMRVVRPETASRVASVCFMGMNVAWTPAAAAERIVKQSPYPQLLAH